MMAALSAFIWGLSGLIVSILVCWVLMIILAAFVGSYAALILDGLKTWWAKW